MTLVRFLLEHGKRGCLNLAIRYAAHFGHLDVIKFLHENRRETTAAPSCDHGYASLLNWWASAERCAGYWLVVAARNGHLDCIEYAHEHNFADFTPSVMTEAAVQGHLDIVKFLYENRTEDCTIRALRNGKPHVVEFLKLLRPMSVRNSGASLRAGDQLLESTNIYEYCEEQDRGMDLFERLELDLNDTEIQYRQGFIDASIRLDKVYI